MLDESWNAMWLLSLSAGALVVDQLSIRPLSRGGETLLWDRISSDASARPAFEHGAPLPG